MLLKKYPKNVPIASHGYPRQAHRSCLALAKRLRREADWIDSARVHRSCGRLWRGAFAPGPAVIRALLQHVEDASVTGQGRSLSSGDRAVWRRRGSACTRRTSPPILQNLVFGTHSSPNTNIPQRSVNQLTLMHDMRGDPAALAGALGQILECDVLLSDQRRI